MNAASCPSPDELRAFVRGELENENIDLIGEHLERCAECDTTVALFDEQSDTFVDKFRVASAEGAVIEDPEFDQAVARIKAIGREPAQPVDPATEDHATPLPGHLRDYRLLARLGEGGMGMVYKALHTKLRRVVALKVLPVHHRRNAASIARFQREIEAVGKLDHPNVVRAFDAGEDDDMHYLVMELVDGVDLHTLVKQQGPLPVADACEIIRQAALGLQHAHELGLVHRDLKPSNLMLSPSASGGRAPTARLVPPGDSATVSGSSNQPAHAGGSPIAQVKILDLGLALLQGDHVASEDITATGQVMGTLDYMAPEQADDSHGVDIRADIYALGCTFYKLLTGHAPFSGDSHNTIAKKLRGHAEDAPPPIRDARPEVPERLADLIARMLAKSPEDRPATPAEVAASLEPFAAENDLAKLAAQAEPPAEDGVLAASAGEIPVLIGGDGGGPGRSPKHDDKSPRHRPGRFWLWTGLLLMGVSTVCQLITITAMTHAVSNAALSPSGMAHMINQSLGPMMLAGPAFVVGLVFVIVGLVRLVLGTAAVAKAPSAARARWRPWCGVAVFLIVLLMIGFTIVTVITPHGQLTIETNDPDVQVVVSTVKENTRIAVVDTRTSKTIQLAPGKFGLRIAGDAAEYELDKDEIIIRRGDRVLVRVTRKPKTTHDDHGTGSPMVFAKGKPVNGLVTALAVHPTTWNVGDEIDFACTYENVSGEAIHVPAWGVVFPAFEFASISPNARGFGLGGKPGDKELGPDAFLKLSAGETKTFKLRGHYNDIQRLTIEGPQGHVIWYRMPADRRFRVRALLDTSDEQHHGFLREQERQRGIPRSWEGKVTSEAVEIRTTDDLFTVPKHERLVPAQRAVGRYELGLALTLWCSSAEWRPGDEIVLGCVYHNMNDEPMFVPAWGVLPTAMELRGPIAGKGVADGDRELIFMDVFAEVPARGSKTFYRRALLDESGRLSITWPTGAVQTWDLQNGQFRLQSLLDTSGHEPLLKRYAADAVRIKQFWQGKAQSSTMEVIVSGLPRSPVDEPTVEPTYSGKPLSYWGEQLNDRDPEYRKKAVSAVVSFGPPGVDPLVEMLRTGDNESKILALSGLRQLVPEADNALPALIAALDDPDAVVRAHAATCVSRFGPRAAEAVPKLLKMLKNEKECLSHAA